MRYTRRWGEVGWGVYGVERKEDNLGELDGVYYSPPFSDRRWRRSWRLGTRNTRRQRGERRMKCHGHRNASRFFPSILLNKLLVFYSFFFRVCIGVCFWVMHSGSSSSRQMMYPAFVRPPQEKKSEKRRKRVKYFGLCWPNTHTQK